MTERLPLGCPSPFLESASGGGIIHGYHFKEAQALSTVSRRLMGKSLASLDKRFTYKIFLIPKARACFGHSRMPRIFKNKQRMSHYYRKSSVLCKELGLAKGQYDRRRRPWAVWTLLSAISLLVLVLCWCSLALVLSDFTLTCNSVLEGLTGWFYCETK